MYRLTRIAPEARWITLPHGVRVLALPATTAIITAMQAAAAQRAREIAEARQIDEHLRNGIAFMAAVQALARYSVQDWAGVADETGAPLAFSPDAVDALMQHDEMAAAFWDAQTQPLRARADEGNV